MRISFTSLIPFPNPIRLCPYRTGRRNSPPFSALTGHYAALQETARRTEERVELDETAKTILDERLKLLCSRLDEHPVIHLTYFQPDEKKQAAKETYTG